MSMVVELERDKRKKKLTIHFVGDTLGDGGSSDSTRLSAGDHLALQLREIREGDELRDSGEGEKEKGIGSAVSSKKEDLGQEGKDGAH